MYVHVVLVNTENIAHNIIITCHELGQEASLVFEAGADNTSGFRLLLNSSEGCFVSAVWQPQVEGRASINLVEVILFLRKRYMQRGEEYAEKYSEIHC